MASVLRRGLLPSETEYLASESTEIEIVPRLSLDRVRLLDGIYGPFLPPAKAKVPLWLAINLRSKKKCDIVPPEWLTVESLQDALDIERKNPQFAPLPPHYAVVAKVLLETAPEDVPNSDTIRGLLKDLRETRQVKIMEGVSAINATHLQMDNITSLEICELRPFFITAFDHLKAIESNSKNVEGEAEGDDSAARGESWNESMEE